MGELCPKFRESLTGRTMNPAQQASLLLNRRWMLPQIRTSRIGESCPGRSGRGISVSGSIGSGTTGTTGRKSLMPVSCRRGGPDVNSVRNNSPELIQPPPGQGSVTGAQFEMTICYEMLAALLFEAVQLIERAGTRYIELSGR